MLQILQLVKSHELVDKSGNTMLHLTLKNETFTEKEVLDVLDILLDRSVILDAQNEANETVLQLAIERRMKDVIDVLLAHNFNMNSATHFMIEDECKKFHYTFLSENNYYDELDSEILNIETESAKFVEWLISKGFDFDSKNEKNQSALFMAIKRNLQHILPTLLKSSQDINFVDESNRNWLHLFLGRNATTDYYRVNENWYFKRYAADIVKILLDRGVSVDAKDNFGDTPVRVAIIEREDIGIVETLLDHSTNVNHENYNEVTLLSTVIREWATSKEADVSEYYMKMAKSLIARGADINKPSKSRWRPVHYAILLHDLRIVEFLRENRAEFNAVTMESETPMHLFLKLSYNPKITNDEAEIRLFELLLLELTTDINHKNCKGETVFYVAIRKWAYSSSAKADYFYMKIARAFIAKGADVNEADESGTNPLVHAIKGRNVRAVKFLGENGADFNVTTKNGENLMHVLVSSSSRGSSCNEVNEKAESKIFDILVRHGYQLDTKDKDGMTLLHIAANRGNQWISRKLLEHGADVNCKNDQMKTPLTNMLTSYYELKADVAELLLEHGANIDAKNIEGCTALHATVIDYEMDSKGKMLQYLLERGADFSVRNQAGHSVLRMAIWDDYHYYVIPDGYEVQPDSLPSLVTCINAGCSKETEFLLKHYVKWNALMGGTKNRYKRLIKRDKYKNCYENCLREIDTLKNTFIGSGTSFYTLLRMDPNSRRAYIYGEQRQTIHSPMLKEQFPEYATLILASYYEAVVRNKILQPAIEAWLELTKIELPDVCVERIFSFLSNSNLFVIIVKD